MCKGAAADEAFEVTAAVATAAVMSDVCEEPQGKRQGVLRGRAAEARGAKGEAESHDGTE